MIEKHDGDICTLREEPAAYTVGFDVQSEALRVKYGYFGDEI